MKLRPFVGLLITTHSVEAVQAAKAVTGELAFEAYHHLALPPGVVDEDGEILDAATLAQVLAQLWVEAGWKIRHVVLGVQGKKAIARLVSLPKIPVNQLQQVVLSEAEQYPAFRDEEPLVDFFTLESEDDASTTVFYAATSSKLVQDYRAMLKKAKLQLLAVDLAHYAALRAQCHLRALPTPQWDGVVIEPGRLVITSWDQDRLGNWREVSLAHLGEEGEEQRFQFIETEISRTLRPEPGQERDVLIARGSLVDSTLAAEHFRRTTELPLQAVGLEAWARRLPPEALALVSPGALGLGLWGQAPVIPVLDLLHRSGTKGSPLDGLSDRLDQLKLDRGLAMAAGVAMVMVLLGFGGVWYYGAVVLGEENAKLVTANAGLQGEISTLTAEQAKLAEQRNANQQILDLIGSQARTNLAVVFLDEVHDLVPEDAWLMALEAPTPETFTLKGASSTQSAGLILASKITEFAEVDRVKVADLSQVEPGRFEYSIEVALKSGATGAAPEGAASPPAGP